MAKLTKKEQAWVNKVQKVLNECPSKRIGFYTMGDNDITLYDVIKDDEIRELLNTNNCSDWGPCVEQLNAGFNETLDFPNPVESVAG
tara:strand:- start:553 stop:813 length:261 start_codon:yes stop_codon:yes gene_type:complete